MKNSTSRTASIFGTLVLFTVVACSMLNSSACGGGDPQSQATVYPTLVTNISQVLMHERGNYTFLVDEPSGQVGQLHIYIYNDGVPVKILRDAEKDKPISISYTCRGKACRPIPLKFSEWWIYAATDFTIHLHSAEEINGAGWNHGEHGSGETTVLR